MHPRNGLTFALAVPGLLLSASALAHPGHQHEPGLLAALKHAVTGWDPLLILLLSLVAGGMLVYGLRSRVSGRRT